MKSASKVWYLEYENMRFTSGRPLTKTEKAVFHTPMAAGHSLRSPQRGPSRAAQPSFVCRPPDTPSKLRVLCQFEPCCQPGRKRFLLVENRAAPHAMQHQHFALCYPRCPFGYPVDSGDVVAKGYVAEDANIPDGVGRRVALTGTCSGERIAVLVLSGDIAARLRGQRLRKPNGTCLGLAIESWRTALAAAIPVPRLKYRRPCVA